jgi:hypothetical protein
VKARWFQTLAALVVAIVLVACGPSRGHGPHNLIVHDDDQDNSIEVYVDHGGGLEYLGSVLSDSTGYFYVYPGTAGVLLELPDGETGARLGGLFFGYGQVHEMSYVP